MRFNSNEAESENNRMSWTMRCMLCPPRKRTTTDDLVGLQNHAMQAHGAHRADLRNATRRRGGPADHYVWSLPDGRDWMEAVKLRTLEEVAV